MERTIKTKAFVVADRKGVELILVDCVAGAFSSLGYLGLACDP